MQVATGKVVQGKIIVDGVSLPEGISVSIFARESEAIVRLPSALQAELEGAIDDADQHEGISAQEMSDKLRKYG
jgi:hypothetical protein